MKIDISTKDYVMKDKLNDLILKKVGKLEKYFNKEVTAKVVCSERKGLYKMEITIISAGQYVRSEIESDNMYANLDTALSKIERQVIKYSDKLVAKRRKDVVEGSMFFDDEPVFETHKIVKNKLFELEPITVEEAIENFELIGNSFYVFLDKDTQRINVIYKRNDGEYGLIETRV